MSISFPRGYSTNYSFGGGASELREKFAKIFNLNSDYLFVRTRVNKDAVKLIADYKRELAEELKMDTSEFTPLFGNDLMDVYLGALERLRTKLRMPVVTYPLVESKGHNLDRNLEQITWPVIHAIREKPGDNSRTKNFIGLVESLNSDSAYEVIRDMETPQNYMLPYVNLLKKEGVAPLVIDKRIWRAHGPFLRDAIDFLDQFHFSSGYRESSRDD